MAAGVDLQEAVKINVTVEKIEIDHIVIETTEETQGEIAQEIAETSEMIDILLTQEGIGNNQEKDKVGLVMLPVCLQFQPTTQNMLLYRNKHLDKAIIY